MENSKVNTQYIKKILEQSKKSPMLSDYTLAYVVAKTNSELPLGQINNIFSISKNKAKVEDNIKVINHRNDGDKYSFVFVKNDEINLTNTDKHATIKEMAKNNSLLKIYIAMGGLNTKRQRSGKKLQENINLAEKTFFVDQSGEIHNLFEIPVAVVDVKENEQDKTLFLDSFKKAKENNKTFCELNRKYIVDQDGTKKQYIYAMVFEKLYTQWQKSNKSETYKNNIGTLINSIRLDLDQASNACNEFIVLEPNFEKGQQLSTQNRAYISKNNSLSVCLIGDSNFDKNFLAKSYKAIGNGFGNFYPIEDLMFLPNKRTLDEILRYLEQTNIENRFNPVFLTEKEILQVQEKVKSLGFLPGTNNSETEKRKTDIYNSKISLEKKLLFADKLKARNAVVISFIKKKHPQFKLNDEKFYEYENWDKFIKYYSELKSLRECMNYKDEQENRTISMKNVYDLGFSDTERNQFVEAYGSFGGKIYDRAFYIRFANYMLDVYKASGAMYDLTYISNQFEASAIEQQKLTSLTQCLKSSGNNYSNIISKMQQLYNEASIESFSNLVKRFNGILSISVNTSNTYRIFKINKNTCFTPKVEEEIGDILGGIVTPWKFDETSPEADKKLFANTTPENYQTTRASHPSFYEDKLKEKLAECEAKTQTTVDNPVA